MQTASYFQILSNAWLLLSPDHGNIIIFWAASRQPSAYEPASSTGGHFSIQSNVQICLFGHKCASFLRVQIALCSGSNTKLASFWLKSHIRPGEWKGTQSFPTVWQAQPAASAPWICSISDLMIALCTQCLDHLSVREANATQGRLTEQGVWE